MKLKDFNIFENKFAMAGLICLLSLIALVLHSCGPYVIEMKPVQVDVVHHVSTTELLNIFEAQCRRDLPSGTSSEINQCAAARVATFLNDLASVLNP